MESIKYTTSEANKVDREIHNLCGMYSEARIKVGLELAQRLLEIEHGNLYLKIDSKAYPNFSAYIASLGMSYHSCRELMGIYQTFVLAAEYTIDELAEISYQKLSIIKPELFRKTGGRYIMTKSKSETNKWLADAKSNLTLNDLKQKRRENSAGPHDHKFEIITFKKCIECGLRTKY